MFRLHRKVRTAEQGFTLVTLLLMTLVLGILALAGMNSSLVQERMAGNARDRNLAMQAAEATLRDAELDIQSHLGLTSGFVGDCTGGLCIPPSMAASNPSSVPVWRSIDWSASAGKSRAYGSATGSAALADVAEPPRYIVELLPTLAPSAGESLNLGNAQEDAPLVFRITARATGLRDTTVVILQSTYVKP